ncbi:MAG: carbonic anhydrase, partial [Vulcanimicrobiaceae bacterium]
AAFLASLTAVAAATVIPGVARAATALEPDPPWVGSPAASLAKLEVGNERFRTGHPIRPPYQTPDARDQKPFAALLVCADSRVGPELVFDQGLGSLFVCRVAGNTADGEVTGSLEYAVEHLHVPLVAVVGHSACGACTEALHTLDTGELPEASVAAVVRAVLPAARTISRSLPPDTRLSRLVAANAALTANTLAMSPVLRRQQLIGRTEVVWGVHDLATGWVRFTPVAASR